jgi:hypothetical protein
MAAIITINGVEVPAPKRGLEIIVSTNVNSGRNANGEVIGQKVGRDIYKLNSLEWPWLTAQEWSTILQLFEGFFAVVKFPDPVHNKMITLKCYPGDRSAKPYWIDSHTKMPTYYTECKVNIIDCGIIDGLSGSGKGSASGDELNVSGQ